MKALAAVPETVFFFEPYYALEFHDTMAKKYNIVRDDVPTIPELLSCSYLNDDARASNILSKFACKETGWMAETPSEIDACIAHRTINTNRTKARCVAASHVVLKVLKLPWLARKLGTSNPIPAGSKAIHLVRHPAAVLKSQFASGWDGLIRPEFISPARSGLSQLASQICYQMAQNDAILALAEPDNVIVVKYETLTDKFPAEIRRVLDFVGIEATAELIQLLKQARATKHADIPVYSEDHVLTYEHALKVVSGVPLCQVVMKRFYPSEARA